MKKMNFRVILIVLSFFLLQSTNGFAACMICMGPGNNNCHIGDGNCVGPNGAGWCPDPPADPNCTPAMTFNPNVDYVSTDDTHAWVVSGTTRIPIASDKLQSFATSMRIKYAKANKSDKKIQLQIQTEYKNFLKTDDGVVSDKRLKLIAKETKLSIRRDVDPKGRPASK